MMTLLQQATDSLAWADAQAVRADTLGAPPLPGGVAAFTRFMMSLPTWVWVVGVLVGGALFAWLAYRFFKDRPERRAWIKSLPRGARIAVFSGAAVLALCAAAFGAATWNYTQHDNDFCSSCHVMTPAFQAMRTSTVHDSLNCHDCHSQSLFASAWQMYVWLKDRPEKIEKHAVVTNETCNACHSGDDEKWQRVARTAGHRVHLESDSSALDSVTCTTCHGEEIHRFVPADRTCGQSGCHRQEDTRIVIGPMAAQSTLHCTTCHQYTAELPQLAAIEAARDTLRPGSNQCFSCHEMRARLAEFNLARDPHGGQCGMCHNPHTQTRPTDAIKQCATSGCHANWRDIPFHTGSNHRRIGSAADQCKTCHTPHAARVDASDCSGCHADAARRNPRMRRLPQAFDTTRALRGALAPHEPARLAPQHASLEKSAGKQPQPPPVAADSFEHRRHTSLACLTCHRTRGSARLTFEAPRGCQICHHQGAAQSRCATCHTDTELAAAPHSELVTVEVRDRPPRQRQVSFVHGAHATTTCTACHTTPVSLAVTDSVRTCAACHDDHHAAGRECAACHSVPATNPPHAPPADAHLRCDACHQAATVALLTPDRSLCLACHQPQRDHVPNRECSTCHFLQDPASYRRHLRAG